MSVLTIRIPEKLLHELDSSVHVSHKLEKNSDLLIDQIEQSIIRNLSLDL